MTAEIGQIGVVRIAIGTANPGQGEAEPVRVRVKHGPPARRRWWSGRLNRRRRRPGRGRGQGVTMPFR